MNSENALATNGDDWLKETSRSRNTLIVTLTEGDILIIDGDYHLVDGEISVYADGTIDKAAGELTQVSPTGIAKAQASNKIIFNIEDAI